MSSSHLAINYYLSCLPPQPLTKPSTHQTTHSLIITHPISLLSTHHSIIYSPPIHITHSPALLYNSSTVLPSHHSHSFTRQLNHLRHSIIYPTTHLPVQNFHITHFPIVSTHLPLHNSTVLFTHLSHTPAITPREHFPRVSRRFKSSCGPARTSFMAIRNLN